MSLGIVRAVDLGVEFAFDPANDILGSGTVGEVLKVKVVKAIEKLTIIQKDHEYALKRFLVRDGRDDFQNEAMILHSLQSEPHEHIMASLAMWTEPPLSFMLFPLADTDLAKFMLQQPPESMSEDYWKWLFKQLRGLCDALRYLHNYEALECGTSRDKDGPLGKVRIGFHHDLKPANILIFGTRPGDMTWKLGDFGSGTVKQVVSSKESIYNRKASTGDPVYSAPEFLVDGRVSRPKDIWSLGCIFLELSVWCLGHDCNVVESFRQARIGACSCTYDSEDAYAKAMYWCERESGTDKIPILNPAVSERFQHLLGVDRKLNVLDQLVRATQDMLSLSPESRPRASTMCRLLEQFS